MRVLIISHNVIDTTGNMGKTIREYFKMFDCEQICQLYFKTEKPTDSSVCKRYFQITDKEVLKSVFTHKSPGHRYSLRTYDIKENSDLMNLSKKIRRSPAKYIARNVAWKLSGWFSDELKKWLADMNPEIIFFMAGDYSFSYEVSYQIAKYLNIPLVIACVDDYYLYNNLQRSLLGKIVYNQYMKKVHKVIGYSKGLVCICEKMASAYEKLFHKPTMVMYTAASDKKLNIKEESRIAYIGNLGLGRDLQIVDIGKTVAELHRENPALPEYIDVYSGEVRHEILNNMSVENGIRFHGKISADEVLQVMERSMAVIHTETFDKYGIERVRYSVSTKIAESLSYGPCLIAYGPEEVASIEYLQQNRAAYVISSKDQLKEGLRTVLCNQEVRNRILENARVTAKDNHNEEKNSSQLKNWMQKIIDEQR